VNSYKIRSMKHGGYNLSAVARFNGVLGHLTCFLLSTFFNTPPLDIHTHTFKNYICTFKLFYSIFKQIILLLIKISTTLIIITY